MGSAVRMGRRGKSEVHIRLRTEIFEFLAEALSLGLILAVGPRLRYFQRIALRVKEAQRRLVAAEDFSFAELIYHQKAGWPVYNSCS